EAQGDHGQGVPGDAGHRAPRADLHADRGVPARRQARRRGHPDARPVPVTGRSLSLSAKSAYFAANFETHVALSVISASAAAMAESSRVRLEGPETLLVFRGFGRRHGPRKPGASVGSAR